MLSAALFITEKTLVTEKESNRWEMVQQSGKAVRVFCGSLNVCRLNAYRTYTAMGKTAFNTYCFV